MVFKAHNPYNRAADIMEVIIRDATGRKMDKMKCNASDKVSQKYIGTKLYKKHDIDLTPDKKEEPEETPFIDSDNSFI